MITNLILMNGYGLYVWLAFSIVIISCAAVYFKTKKTLKKYEKEFAFELKKLSDFEQKAVLEKSKVATQILESQNKIA
jgi:heme exporter protein D